MRPGVVTQLHLTGIDHGPQRGGVDRPRTVGGVDEKRQPGAAVTAEVGERAHHLRAGAVVNGQRQLIAIPGKPGKHAGWWPLGRETTRGRGATGRRENANRNATQQRAAIYLPHISTLLLGAFPRKRPAFVVCLDFRLRATGPSGSHHRERSDRLGSNWNVDPRLTFASDTFGSSVAAVSISASSAVRLSICGSAEPCSTWPPHHLSLCEPATLSRPEVAHLYSAARTTAGQARMLGGSDLVSVHRSLNHPGLDPPQISDDASGLEVDTR